VSGLFAIVVKWRKKNCMTKICGTDIANKELELELEV
jgi:hypothetical protein